MRIAAAHVRNVYATAFADCRASNPVSKPSFIFTHVFALYCRAYVMPYEKNKQTNNKKKQSPNVHPVLIERSNEYFFFFRTMPYCRDYFERGIYAKYSWEIAFGRLIFGKCQALCVIISIRRGLQFCNSDNSKIDFLFLF